MDLPLFILCVTHKALPIIDLMSFFSQNLHVSEFRFPIGKKMEQVASQLVN